MEPQLNSSGSFKKYAGYLLLFIISIFVYVWVSSPLVVTVTGTGDVSSKAETATLTFSLSANGDNPQSVTSALKSGIGRVKETLKTMGVPEGNIYESQIAIFPASAVKESAVGFQATVSMGIKTNQVSSLDNLVTSLYEQGALVVTQPVLSVGDIESLEKTAYDMAVKDAKKKALALQLSNLKIFKKIVLIEQSTTGATSTVTSKAGTVDQVEKNISPDDGLIKISKVVSVSYKMW